MQHNLPSSLQPKERSVRTAFRVLPSVPPRCFLGGMHIGSREEARKKATFAELGAGESRFALGQSPSLDL